MVCCTKLTIASVVWLLILFLPVERPPPSTEKEWGKENLLAFFIVLTQTTMCPKSLVLTCLQITDSVLQGHSISSSNMYYTVSARLVTWKIKIQELVEGKNSEQQYTC